MNFKYWLSLPLLFISIIISAQEQKPDSTSHTNPKSDKVQVKEINLDSLVWFFEDFKKNISIDSSWQNLLANQNIYNQNRDILKNQDYIEEVKIELNTDTLKKRLARLNAKTPLDISYNESLESVIQYYLKREKETTENLISLSQYYFPLFEQILDKNDIPLEIKYLAVVESALNPRAKSGAGAAGLWQFMYPTGKMYDLEVSSYVDERMDPLRSSEAAAKYLKRLYGIFDDWNLALAAYNSGPGNVSKAIRRSGGQKDYWSLRQHLPRETAGYVPSFMAILYIFEYAQDHNLQPQLPQMHYLATDTIQTKDLIKLDHVAEITNTDIDFLKFLNPSYKLGIIPHDKEKNYSIRLPYKAAGLFVANEDLVYNFTKKALDVSEEKLPKYFKVSDKIRYKVKSGDYLGKIATQYGVRISDIKRWNNLRNSRLKIGQRLTIFPRKANYSQSPTRKSEKNDNSSSEKQTTYVVKPGDSLWSISRKFEGLSVKDLKEINNLKQNTLKPGMTLKLQS